MPNKMTGFIPELAILNIHDKHMAGHFETHKKVIIGGNVGGGGGVPRTIHLTYFGLIPSSEETQLEFAL